MQEPEFEKQVRRAMDELEFDPSSGVWPGVEQQIHEEERKRRPVFWLFLLSGLLVGSLVLGGIYLTNMTRVSRIFQQPRQADRIQNTVNSSGKEIPKDLNALSKNTIAGHPSSRVSKANDYALNGSLHHNRPLGSLHRSSVNGLSEPSLFQPAPAEKEVPEIKKTRESEPDSLNRSTETASLIGDSKPAQGQVRDSFPEASESKIPEKNPGTMVQTEPDTTTTSKNPVTANTLENTSKSKPAGSWSLIGWVNPGISNMNPASLDHLINGGTVRNLFLYGGNNPSVGGARQAPHVAYHPGFAAQVGFGISRRIAKKWSVSTGIQYHYASFSLETGSGEATPSYYNISASKYYPVGQGYRYRNQAHYVQIPISAAYRIAQGKKHALQAETGIALSRMVSTNTLYYDRSIGGYYSDASQCNDWQVFGHAALLISLPLTHSSIQVGPRVDYSFSTFQKTSSGNPGHLAMGGLFMAYSFGK